MSPYSAHSWVVVLQYHKRGYRDTIICPFVIIICYLVPCFSSWILPILIPPSPPSPLLLFFCRRPRSHQIHSLLHPPPFNDSRPCPLHCFLAESQNRSIRNVLHDCILPPKYICIHLLETHILHCRLQMWLLPTSVQKPLGLTTCNTSGYPILDPPPQGLAHLGGHYPRL